MQGAPKVILPAAYITKRDKTDYILALFLKKKKILANDMNGMADDVPQNNAIWLNLTRAISAEGLQWEKVGEAHIPEILAL